MTGDSLPSRDNYDAIVIGGGFYGCRLALTLRRSRLSVLLLEREARLLDRASLRNQARIHNGYHYPRSILTSLRSRVNYKRFLTEYGDCVHDGFQHYYAVSRGATWVTAAQFVEFCRRIAAPLTPAPEAVRRMFDADRIDDVFLVQESAFDATKLRARLVQDLSDAGVEVRTGAFVARLEADAGMCALNIIPSQNVVAGQGGVEVRSASAPIVLNCTYAALNNVLASAGAEVVPLKREYTEMALVEVPEELKEMGITVIDGPFFSLIPHPPRAGLHTLSHVRYTPHAWRMDHPDGTPLVTNELAGRRPSRFAHMVRDAARYLPIIREARQVDSIWETKMVMPRSEQDDSRPILCSPSAAIPGLYSILGAKIDSIYDVEEAFTRIALGESRMVPA